ncbi:MAG: site-specific integrase [Saccharospirillaceae bacterium]|nr:site-specific integrase [Saccharospirillaceae bacterium]
MAKITQRNGFLVFDFNYKNTRCRESTVLQDSNSNRKRAEIILNRITAEIKTKTFDYLTYFPKSKMAKKLLHKQNEISEITNSIPTLNVFCHNWLKEMKPGWKQSYIDQVTRNLNNYILIQFGNFNISDITKSMVLMFRSDLTQINEFSGGNKRALAPATINKIITLLRSIIEEATLRFDIDFKLSNIKPLKGIRPDVQPLSINEIDKFLEQVRPDFKEYFITRFFTGLRSGEVHGLQWKHIDFANRQIIIEQAYGEYGITTPKNEYAYREVQMCQIVFDALKIQQTRTTHKNGFVFSNSQGNAISSNAVNEKIWKPTLKCLNFPERRVYQTRHTAATLWLASGENPEWIARQLGHSNTQMLFRIYSRYIPNALRTDGVAFNQMIKNNITAIK